MALIRTIVVVSLVCVVKAETDIDGVVIRIGSPSLNCFPRRHLANLRVGGPTDTLLRKKK